MANSAVRKATPFQKGFRERRFESGGIGNVTSSFVSNRDIYRITMVRDDVSDDSVGDGEAGRFGVINNYLALAYNTQCQFWINHVLPRKVPVAQLEGCHRL